MYFLPLKRKEKNNKLVKYIRRFRTVQIFFSDIYSDSKLRNYFLLESQEKIVIVNDEILMLTPLFKEEK